MADPTPILSDSILVTVRRGVGLEDDYTAFDRNILVHINSYLQVLWMQGIGTSGFKVTGESETWGDFLGEHKDDLQMAASYVIIRVQLIFDPPQSSALYNAYKEEAKELGWYLGIEGDILSDEEVDDDEED